MAFLEASPLPDLEEAVAVSIAAAIWDKFLEPSERAGLTPEDPGYTAWNAQEHERIQKLEQRIVHADPAPNLDHGGVLRLARFVYRNEDLRNAFLRNFVGYTPPANTS